MWATGGTGIFTQTGGTNLPRHFPWRSGSDPLPEDDVKTPGTYNLNGGLLQTTFIIVGN